MRISNLSNFYQSIRIFAILSLVIINSCSSTKTSRYIASIENPEFENYFLPHQYRHLSTQDIPEEVVDKVNQSLNNALARLYRDLELPIVDKDKLPRKVKYFDYIKQLLPAGTDVLPSGGVVRSSLSYLYDLMYKSNIKDPIAFLDSFANQNTPIQSHHVRGLGSDWDILIRSYDGHEFEYLKDIIIKITNSSEEHLEIQDDSFLFKRSIVTIGDVKNYDEQIKRASAQGGSTLDFLAFSVNEGQLIESKYHTGVVKDFILGSYSYVSPMNEASIENPQQQTIRGLRPLLELPHLNLKNDEVLYNELTKLVLVHPEDLNDRAISQFSKMIRNARYSGARNRFYKDNGSRIEETVKKMNIEWSRHFGYKLIPEFVDWRQPSDLSPPSEIKQFLLPVKNFIDQYTDNGIIYHGTPEAQNALSILRQGLMISNINQGRAAFGRGAYSSMEYEIASVYAGNDGVIFPLEVDNEKSLRIVDWQEIDKEELKKVLQINSHISDDELMEVFIKKYQIDIVVNSYVLIQNSYAIKPMNDLTKVVNAYAISSKEVDTLAKLIKSVKTHQRLYEYVKILEPEADLVKPLDLEKIIDQKITELKNTSSNEIINWYLVMEKKLIKDLNLSELDFYAHGFTIFSDFEALEDLTEAQKEDINKIALKVVRSFIEEHNVLQDSENASIFFKKLRSLYVKSPSFLKESKTYLREIVEEEIKQIRKSGLYQNIPLSSFFSIAHFFNLTDSDMQINNVFSIFYDEIIDYIYLMDSNSILHILSNLIHTEENYPSISDSQFKKVKSTLEFHLLDRIDPSLDPILLAKVFKNHFFPIKDNFFTKEDFLIKYKSILINNHISSAGFIDESIKTSLSYLLESGYIESTEISFILNKTNDNILKQSFFLDAIEQYPTLAYDPSYLPIIEEFLKTFIQSSSDGSLESELLMFIKKKDYNKVQSYLLANKEEILKQSTSIVKVLESIKDVDFIGDFYTEFSSIDTNCNKLVFSFSN